MTDKTRALADEADNLCSLLEDLETKIGAMSENDLAMELVNEAFELALKLKTALLSKAQVEQLEGTA